MYRSTDAPVPGILVESVRRLTREELDRIGKFGQHRRRGREGGEGGDAGRQVEAEHVVHAVLAGLDEDALFGDFYNGDQ